MVAFSPGVALLLVGIAGAAVLAVLTTLASLVRNATAVVDLHASATALRIDYAKQLAGADQGAAIEVDEAQPEAPPLAVPAA